MPLNLNVRALCQSMHPHVMETSKPWIKKLNNGLFFENLFIFIPHNLPYSPPFLALLVKLKCEVERCHRPVNCVAGAAGRAGHGALPSSSVLVCCHRLFPAGSRQTSRVSTVGCQGHVARPALALAFLPFFAFFLAFFCLFFLPFCLLFCLFAFFFCHFAFAWARCWCGLWRRGRALAKSGTLLNTRL